MEKVIIGGGLGYLAGHLFGGFGIVARGGGFGVSRSVVAIVTAVGGVYVADKIGNLIKK